jgi:toxin ParE1/3/4
MSAWHLSQAASLDIDRAWIYIHERNPKAADEVVAELYKTLDTLADNPRMGRVRAELTRAPRSFPLTGRPYVIFYHPIDNGIRIIRVILASQDLDRAY